MLDTSFNMQKATAMQQDRVAAQRKESEASREAKSDVDFKSVMAESNRAETERLLEEKAASADGVLRVGESASDKEFRQQLEKITGKKQTAAKNQLNRDDFLNLMVTQMRYQDPTKPMDNKEMATQLAQFNTVEQLESVNKNLQGMSSAQQASNAQYLTQYMGKMIEVQGNAFQIGTKGPLNDLTVKLPAAAGEVSVTIRNDANAVVRRLALGGQQAGPVAVKWDGKDDTGKELPAGKYTLSAEATTKDGKPLKAQTIVSAMVKGVTDIANGGKLETTAGPVAVNTIDAVRMPGEDSAKQSKAPENPPVAQGEAPPAKAQSSM